ncbi:ASCH domain-containing protein [Phytomonospora sp. NPDC050363]|uniref:ASCH domain-containing protein n=1 Tax=Phytomonospora sp. NPDC050363 TaxID=3155642 RepID=UPI0033D6A597
MTTDASGLPLAEFGFPGPLRDQLVAAILSGAKTSTTGVLADYEYCGDPLPVAGDLAAVVDSAGRRVAIIETTSAVVAPLSAVDAQHAIDEGEGYDDVPGWRAAHEEFWHDKEFRDAIGDPDFTVDEDTPLVLVRFRLAEVLDEPA